MVLLQVDLLLLCLSVYFLIKYQIGLRMDSPREYRFSTAITNDMCSC
jgi:hypothetical protein